MVLAISVIGVSGSGKTTTIEYLISCLSKEGFRVGSIKHVHRTEFSIDTPGKDTWRHMKAGALVTVSVAPKEIAVIKKTTASKNQHDLDKIISLLDNEALDIIFLEGLHSLVAKRTDIPKIIAAKDLGDLKKILEGTTPPILAVTGLVARDKFDARVLSDLKIPIIDLYKEGDALLELVKNYISNLHVRPDSR